MKRLLKAGGMSWKRMRNSLRSNRDEDLFRIFEKELQLLREQAVKGEIDLYFFDEVGFNLKPNVPYAWQPIGTTAELPASRSSKDNFTVLGLLNIEKQEFDGQVYQGAANQQCVLKAIETLAIKAAINYTENERKSVLILDNASIHTAKIIKENIEKWRTMGLLLQFIPAYSPELNLIEILWKQLKHFWLQQEHYASNQTLKNAVINILNKYGTQYLINFG